MKEKKKLMIVEPLLLLLLLLLLLWLLPLVIVDSLRLKNLLLGSNKMNKKRLTNQIVCWSCGAINVVLVSPGRHP